MKSRKSELPQRTRHFQDLSEFTSHSSHDVSDDAMEKRANSIQFLRSKLEPGPNKPKLVSSAHGKIKKILFTIPYYITKGKDNPLWNIYKNLFSNLPDYTEIVVFAAEESEKLILEWFRENNKKNKLLLVHMPLYINATIWAEDACAVSFDEESGSYFFIEPHSFPRWGDGFIAYFLSTKLKYKRVRVPIYFEGGNILIGDDFFLIGTDYPLKTLQYFDEILNIKSSKNKANCITELYKKFLDKFRNMIYVGSTLPVPSKKEKSFKKGTRKWKEFFFQNNEGGTVQPLFHIDMFITLAGRSKNGKYQILVGDPRMAGEILKLDFSSYSLPELFDDIADGLSREGFEVIRNPMPIVYMDNPAKKERDWYFATYNNALVEIINDKNKTIWLPTYGYGDWEELKKTDEFNRNLFDNLGFKVILLTDYHAIAEKSGSLHCIKKYLEREESN